MKIGLSLSKCMLDIIEGRVDVNDVLVIVARTDFDPNDDKHWKAIWEGYSGGGFGSLPAWQGHPDGEQDFRDLAVELWEDGKLHQPRRFGAHPPRINWHWLETFAPTEDVEKNPAVKKAWENYKMLAGLS